VGQRSPSRADRGRAGHRPDRTGAERHKKGSPGPGDQQDQDQHRPRGRALFPGQTRADQVAEPCHRMMSHPLGPFRGNAGVPSGQKFPAKLLNVTDKRVRRFYLKGNLILP
jgi:hypothetical protein